MKFGGTSVEDATAIDRIAGIVKDRVAGAPARRGKRDGEGHRPTARHGGGSGRRRSRQVARALPQAARTALHHRRRAAWHRAAHRAAFRAGRHVRLARTVAARHLRCRRADAAHLRSRCVVRRAAVEHDRDPGVRGARPEGRAARRAPGHRHRRTAHARGSADR